MKSSKDDRLNMLEDRAWRYRRALERKHSRQIARCLEDTIREIADLRKARVAAQVAEAGGAA